MTGELEARLTQEQRRELAGLTTPAGIQAYLDAIPYSAENANRCPLRVVQERRAHCLDGGLLAAAALRRLGYPPLIVDLLPEPGTDDDHVLAIYRLDGCYGAVAKSNFSGLRSREPVYRSLRELVMSYFDDFFNVDRSRTLRGYTRALNLATLDRQGWEWRDAGADAVERHLARLRHIPVIGAAAAAGLSPVDPLSYRAGTLGTDPEGLFKPRA
jgi:hypothetical protein